MGSLPFWHTPTLTNADERNNRMEPRAIIRMGAAAHDLMVPGHPTVDLSKLKPEDRPGLTTALIEHLGIKDRRSKPKRGKLPPTPQRM